MIQLRGYYIEKIRASDAVGIHHLMTSNAERFYSKLLYLKIILEV